MTMIILNMNQRNSVRFFIILIFINSIFCNSINPSSSIIFTTLGRSSYAFDIYTIPVTDQLNAGAEFRLTDGKSVNFNGHFPSSSSILSTPPDQNLIYVTERNGSYSIYLDAISGYTRTRSILEVPTESARFQVPLIENSGNRFSMKDRPNLAGEYLIYVSTHENSHVPRTSWAAVYSTHIKSGSTRRLTPDGIADFSPAVSPGGTYTAVASHGDKGWGGEVEELATDIYVFSTKDGSGRVKIVEHGGWPSWADESTLYFHRRGDDGWWAIYRAIIPKTGLIDVKSVVTQRVTPPGLHVFTPAASVTNKSFIAVATRRPGSDYRHIELYDVVSKRFIELTRPVSPNVHHFNPFISPDSTRIGYHKCRGHTKHLLLENIRNPVPGISLFRIDGSFPSFSPDGSRIAYVDLPGLYIVNHNGTNRREISKENAFSTAWDPIRKGVIYTSIGPDFSSVNTDVDIISINVDDDVLTHKKLTAGGKNNAFPSPSPDGKRIVFRSGRTGYKNLYIMDSVHGESSGLHRLTNGPWTDTMCNWSPKGDWIAFASDRENPGGGSFELFMIHPNGTGLRKLVQSGSGGRTNHPWFSPDGEYIVFTSDYGAVSAEPVSNPHAYQPYGDIYIIRSDGSGLRRLTHNSYEDGTPCWGPTYMKPADVEWQNVGPDCSFADCHWLKISGVSHGDKRAPLDTTKIKCG